MSARNFLIFGATGKQGGAAIAALINSPLASTFKIYAVTRNPESASAKKLAAKHSSITPIKGEVDNSDAIFNSIGVPIDGVFAVTVPSMKKGETDVEVRQGKAIIDAAVAHKVKHFVFSSVDRGGAKSDNNPTYVPHFLSKHAVEEYLKSKNLRWTILRPVAFMENMDPGFLGKVFGSWWSQMGNTKLQLISSSDIGVFGAKALMEPEKFENKAITLVGDELSFAEANTIYKNVYGTNIPTTFGFLASFMKWMIEDINLMFRWFVDEGYGGDIAECREIYPETQSLEVWLKAQQKA